jgi:hypothetical protein
MPSQHLNYDIAANTTPTLAFDTGATGAVAELRFMFGGAQEMRITRIVSTSGAVDITFADATPHDATIFCNQNPVTTDGGSFTVTVSNPDARTHKLAVSAIYRA